MGIYQQPHRSILTITVGGAALAASLLFAAYSLQVDNRTSQYLYLPDIQQYVFPYQTGVILPFGPSTNVRANFAPPPGIAQPAAIAGQVARIEAFDLALPPNPGILQSMDVNLTNGSIDANITNSTLDTNANITNANINANITNANINANITNSQIDINDITPVININYINQNLAFTAGQTQLMFAIPINYRIHGWILSGNAQGFIALYQGPSGSSGSEIYQGYQQAYQPSIVTFSPQASIVTPLNANYIWVYSGVTQEIALTMYYAIN